MVALAQKITSSKQFQIAIIVLILVCGALSGIESYYMRAERSPVLDQLASLQQVILWIFAAEIVLKIAACGSRPWAYFRNVWNVFDFLIVALCLMPLDKQYGAVLRMARLVRTLRLVTLLPKLQLLVSALLKSIPALGYVGILLGLHFFMYSVIGTFLFGRNDPLRFGDLHHSFLTLFQVMTLEGWNDVLATQFFGSDVGYDDAWKGLAGTSRTSAGQPVLAAIYFVSFIGLGTMIMLNLFTGVIINSMEEASNEAAESKRRKNLETRGHVTIGDELGEVGRKLQELAGQIEVLTRNNAEALNRNAAGGAGNGRAGAPIAIDTGKLA